MSNARITELLSEIERLLEAVRSEVKLQHQEEEVTSKVGPPPESSAVYSSAETKVLSALAELETRTAQAAATRFLIAALTEVAIKSPSFERTLDTLEEKGLIRSIGDRLILTDAGRAESKVYNLRDLTSRVLMDKIAVQLSKSQNTIIRMLFDTQGAVPLNSIREALPYASESALRKDLAELVRIGLIQKAGQSTYTYAEELYVND